MQNLGQNANEVDSLKINSLELAVEQGVISISHIQRKFCVGYAKAGGIIDWMEREGFVTPNEGGSVRKTLLSKEKFEMIKNGTYPVDGLIKQQEVQEKQESQQVKKKEVNNETKYFDLVEKRSIKNNLKAKNEEKIKELWNEFYELDERENFAEARVVLEKLVEKGEVDALNLIGDLYLYGLGEDVDYAKARVFYNEALMKGSIKAKYHIANLYYYGLGVEQDYKQAFDLYKELADKNIASGYKRMAQMYMEGNYVDKNFVKAFDLLEKALEINPECQGAKTLKNAIVVLKTICEEKVVSISFLQRRLQLGYSPVCMALEYLEEQEYIAKKEILITDEEYKKLFDGK